MAERECQATLPNPQPKRPLAPSPSTNKSIKRNGPGVNGKTYSQRYQERLAGYRAIREQDLKEAFQPIPTPTTSAEGSIPVRGGHNDKTPPKRILNYRLTENHEPLSNDAIAGILLQCTPDSLKAQTWINAHKASRIAAERKKVPLRKRGGLRKHVLQLRPKSEWTKVVRSRSREASTEADRIEEESREILSRLSPREGDVNTTRAEQSEIAHVLDEDKQMVRVFKSSGRLQILVCDEATAVLSGRIKREFRKHFASPESDDT
ncbi:hypothetical protein BJX76DRAFT_129834 [Aspergillus varians]